MNNRQFAAAHDRYLDPPDEEFDDTTDEMDLADIKRQKQVDKEIRDINKALGKEK